MNPAETRIVLYPENGAATPSEQALFEYVAQREQNPLPEGWSESFLLRTEDKAYFASYLENADYLVQLSLPDGIGPGACWSMIEVFRKDRGTPTASEAIEVAKRLFGPFLSVVADHEVECIAIHGDLSDRPIDQAWWYQSGQPGFHLGWSIDLGLSPDRPAAPTPPVQPIPVALPNTLGNSLLHPEGNVEQLLRYEADRFRIITTWLKQQPRERLLDHEADRHKAVSTWLMRCFARLLSTHPRRLIPVGEDTICEYFERISLQDARPG
jgi:hypothetical protein